MMTPPPTLATGLPAQAAADARLCALAARRVVLPVAALGALAVVGFAAALVMTAFVLTSDDGTRALDMDYRVFWAAARLALEGAFLAPFDLATLGAVHNVSPEEWMPWLYPPGYLLLIAPLGAPPFAVSYTLMTVLSVIALALAVRPFTGGSKTAWLAFALAPAYLPALVIGQNSLLWFAVLLAALAALRAERWALCGVLIGCLTLKPQLGLMIPVALLAAGLWRTVLVATLTAILLAALPTLVTGPGYWPLLWERLGDQGSRLVEVIGQVELMVGPFSLLAGLGVAPGTALVLQGLLTLLAALAVGLTWASSRTGPDARAAVLLTAIFLSAPYLWYYEAALMALVGLFLTRAGLVRARVPGLVLLAVLWLGAGLQVMNIFVDLGDEDFPWAVILTPAMLLCLGLCLLHLWSLHRAPSAR
jgi:hypothetical protein